MSDKLRYARALLKNGNEANSSMAEESRAARQEDGQKDTAWW